jgi:hypothetical protein
MVQLSSSSPNALPPAKATSMLCQRTSVYHGAMTLPLPSGYRVPWQNPTAPACSG